MSFYEIEWLDENMHRNYPLADDATGKSTDGSYLPSSFLVDMFISTPPSADAGSSGRFFVSGIDYAGDSVKVRISYQAPNGTAYLVASSEEIPLTARAGDAVNTRTFQLLSENSTYESMKYINGNLIVGTCADLSATTAYQLTYADGKILPAVVLQNIAGITRITAELTDGSAEDFLSSFIIRAGDGIELSVREEMVSGLLTKILVVTRVPTLAEQDAEYKTVDDVLSAVRSALGSPILSINGVLPDSSGAFLITPEDCTGITASGNGLVISNPCAKPCCDSATDSTITVALASLEATANSMNNYFQGQATTINIINSGLASLVASRK